MDFMSGRKCMEQLPKRRSSLRLEGFDYSSEGCYFVTINCRENKKYFAKNRIGDIIKNNIEKLNGAFSLTIGECAIMENHLHLMITIKNGNNTNLSRVIQSFKSLIAKEVREKLGIYDKIWQRGFYDHIIRNEKDYREKMKYIMNNPLNIELGRR